MIRPLPQALASYVTECFGYRAEGVPKYDHIGLPGPTVVVVIDLADCVRVSGLGNAARRDSG
ncbi:hypothetical protein [Demetria terragena]|uniref:hypothetical protein n=1 Tax=Demetria terragena TaxID=63959 RepID=UPI000364D6A2|nr:hypothetical protein [Demetria terragena]